MRSEGTTSVPGWPAMMRRVTAAAYLDMSEAELERGVISGQIPMPIKIIDRERWSRHHIDEAVRLATSEVTADWRKSSKLYSDDWRSKQPLYGGGKE